MSSRYRNKMVWFVAVLLLILSACDLQKGSIRAMGPDHVAVEQSDAWARPLQTYLSFSQELLVEAVAWSPDATKIASLDYWSNRINVWDVAAGKKIIETKKKSGPSEILTFTRDGKFLLVQSLTAGFDDRNTTLSILDATTGQVVHTLEGPSPGKGNFPRFISLSRDGRYLALIITGNRNTIYVYDTDGWNLERKLVLPPRRYFTGGLAFSSDERMLAAGGGGGFVFRCGFLSGKCDDGLKPYDASVIGVEFSPDSGLLLAAINNAM